MIRRLLVIPARSGSKRIKNKNFKNFCGKPIIFHSLNVAKKSKLFNKNAYIYDFLDRSFIESLLNQHINGEQNRRLLIWSLLNVEESLSQNL